MHKNRDFSAIKAILALLLAGFAALPGGCASQPDAWSRLPPPTDGLPRTGGHGSELLIHRLSPADLPDGLRTSPGKGSEASETPKRDEIGDAAYSLAEFKLDFDEFAPLLTRALAEMEWTTVRTDGRPTGLASDALSPDGRTIAIRAGITAHRGTAVCVRVGLFGDSEVESTFLKRLHKLAAARGQ